MKPTLLLTGARTPVTLDLARSLKHHGYRVIGVESLKFPLSKHSRAFSKFYTIAAPNASLDQFRDDLIRIIKKEKVTLIIPTCEEVFHLARIKRELPCETLVDSFELLNQLHSKFEFNLLCKKEGLTAPDSFCVKSVDEARSLLQRLKWDEYVLKPEFSRFASNTRILESKNVLPFLTASSLKGGIPWVIQKYLRGPEYCTYSLAKAGKLLAHVTYDHEFTAGRGAGIFFRAVLKSKVEAWVKAFVEKTNFTGQVAFDFIELPDGSVYALECNPRATSGLHLILRDADFLDALTGRKSTSGIVRPNLKEEGQIRLAMLVYGLPSVRSPEHFMRWLKTFFGAREVVFSLQDPVPFFDQFVSFLTLIAAAQKLKVTPLEVSTRDIEWNGKGTS